jgi:hypothetical protein
MAQEDNNQQQVRSQEQPPVVQRLHKGMYQDCKPIDQPEGSYRYALNAILDSKEGAKNFITNEYGTRPSTQLSEGFVPLGWCYLTDNTIAIISHGLLLGIDEIGIIDKNEVYKPFCRTKLGLDVKHQVDITHRVRRAGDRLIYFTDGLNKPRYFNFDRLYDFYTGEYKNWINDGSNPTTEPVNNKWELDAFELIASYSFIPSFKTITVESAGDMYSGSYSFGVFYVDENMNHTECVTISNRVNIYDDEESKAYPHINGSRNSMNQTELQSTFVKWSKVNKSIHIEFDNLDERFPYYKVAIICYTAEDGNVKEVLLSNPISILNTRFVYSGQDTQFERIETQDVSIASARISRASHIEQIENKLVLADIWEKDINWLIFQKYASQIKSKLVRKHINLESVRAEGNPKNPVGPMNFTGYMPGEVYSFGINYIFKDGEVSPTYHIPGNLVDNEDQGSGDNEMKHRHCLSIYPRIHKADEPNYWGNDWNGRPLEDTPIRHHRFPFRDEAGDKLFEDFRGEEGDVDSPDIHNPSLNEVLVIYMARAGDTTAGNDSGTGISTGPVTVFFKYKGDPTLRSQTVVPATTRTTQWVIIPVTYPPGSSTAETQLQLRMQYVAIIAEPGKEFEPEWTDNFDMGGTIGVIAIGTKNTTWTDIYASVPGRRLISYAYLFPRFGPVCARFGCSGGQIPNHELNLIPLTALHDFATPPVLADNNVYVSPAGEDMIIPGGGAGSVSAGRPRGITIYGIDFDNIILPSEYADNIIGYYIVRNESEITDRIIADNALFGKIVQSKSYMGKDERGSSAVAPVANSFITFGLLDYRWRNTDSSGKATDNEAEQYPVPAHIRDNYLYAFSPIHQFKHRNFRSDKLRIKTMFDCNTPGGSRSGNRSFGGTYINDVQEGSTFMPGAHQGTDDDGMDLLIKYRENAIHSVQNLPYTEVMPNPLYNRTFPIITYPGNKEGEMNIETIFHLVAAGYQLDNDEAVFNASCDNRAMIVKLPEKRPDGITNFHYGFWDNAEKEGEIFSSKFYYGTFINNPQEPYANFMGRPYYREHMNPKYISELYSATKQYKKGDVVRVPWDTGDNISDIVYIAKISSIGISVTDTTYWSRTTSAKSRIFSGDAYLCPYSLVNTNYYGIKEAARLKKKVPWWMWVVGAAALVIGCILSVVGVGIAIVGAVLAIGLGFLYAATNSYLTIESLFEMSQVHYKTGLKECIIDVNTVDIRNGRGSKPDEDRNAYPDDRIEYHLDRISNVFIESRLNTHLRTQPVSQSGFCPAPGIVGGNSTSDWYLLGMDTSTDDTLSTAGNRGASQQWTNLSMEMYMKSKLTFIDQQRGDGRGYLGIPMTEIYDLNDDYIHVSKERTFHYLPIEYTINVEESNHYDHRIMWSETSFQEEINDNFRVFLPNNYKDIEGEFGAITDLVRKSNKMYVFTRESFWYLPANIQQQITGELTTVIGTGEFFAIPPQKIVTDKHGSGGTTDKWSVVVTRYGIYYVSRIEGKAYKYVEPSSNWQQPGEGLSEISLQGGMYRHFADNLNSEFNDKWFKICGKNFPHMANPMSGFGIHGTFDPEFYRIIFTVNEWDYGNISNVNCKTLSFQNTGGQGEDRSWTIAYDILSDKWISFHSYLPKMYFSIPNGYYAWDWISNRFHKHNIKGTHCNYYGKAEDYIIELVSLSNPLPTRTWEDVSIQTIVEKYDTSFNKYIEIHDDMFDKVLFYNSKQSSGVLEILTRWKESHDWMMSTIALPEGTIRANRIEHDWRMNELRDMVTNYSLPMFLTDWNSIKSTYPIDKVINPAIFSKKDWKEQQLFRDKYLLIRLILSKFADRNIQLTTTYTLETEQISIR